MLQECQFLPGHTKQSVCRERLCGAETLPWLFPLSEWHGRSVARLLQPAQARKTPVAGAWWLLAGSLLRAPARLQLWVGVSRRSRWSRSGERGGVHLQNALQCPCPPCTATNVQPTITTFLRRLAPSTRSPGRLIRITMPWRPPALSRPVLLLPGPLNLARGQRGSGGAPNQ